MNKKLTASSAPLAALAISHNDASSDPYVDNLYEQLPKAADQAPAEVGLNHPLPVQKAVNKLSEHRENG